MGSVCSISLPCDAMATRCWDDCFRDRSTYIFDLEDHLLALISASKELIVKRDDILTRVNLAEQQQGFKRLSEVQLWLSSVDFVETQVNSLISDGPREVNRLYFGGCCSSDFKTSFKFGKSVAKKLEEVNSLKNRGVFVEVAGREIASVVDVRPVEQTVGLEVTFARVWSCLEDETIGIIGLYGMGGVGKTMILKRINNNFCEKPNDFDLVVWIVVSKDLKIEKIQEDIGKKIGFSNDDWNSQSYDDKAVDIYKVLSQKKFVLLLDDVWEPINLIEVGIPNPTVQNSSKIVFTARSEEVCYQIKAQQRIKVECLTWEKAWELFRDKVGDDTINAHPDIPQLAEIVAKECGGLPLALITIGRAMAGKRVPREWKHAITVLRRDASQIIGMGDKVFPILKFSYDNLQNDKIRSCLLFCALFPEDYNISKESLIDYWIGEGILDDVDRRGAENEGYGFIGTLSRACLLEDAGKFVKMHDVIRVMALWIASKNGKVKDIYLVKAGAQLTKIPTDITKIEHVQRMSFMANKIDYLCRTPKWKNLQSLILSENSLCSIPSDFFQFMSSLRVLDLSKNQDLVTLPSGILRLVSLEYLNLSATKIQHLPMELIKLVNLKYLNLEHTPIVYKFPLQVMSGFSNLQVLRIDGYKYSDMVEGDFFFIENEKLVDELQNLKQLVRLTLPIVSTIALHKFLSFEELRNSSQALSLYTMSGLEELDVSSLTKMKNLEKLSINKCEDLKDMKISFHRSVILTDHFFYCLRNVRIENCHKLRDLTWLILAPNLNSLKVSYCNGMEEIINDGKSDLLESIKPFAKLEVLNLQILPKLKSICEKSLPLTCLREIVATSCPQLVKLPLDSKNGQDRKIVIKGYQSWWDELEWEDEATKTAFASSFMVYLGEVSGVLCSSFLLFLGRKDCSHKSQGSSESKNLRSYVARFIMKMQQLTVLRAVALYTHVCESRRFRTSLKLEYWPCVIV
ncbi:hypothetical protein ACFE04_004014 [Oxalis oulophora]